jgi:hypothetical protein
MCPECRREGKLEKRNFSGKGKIHAFSTVYAPPRGLELHKPYIIAIIELEEGPKITAQVVDCEPEDVRVGQSVESTFRKIKEAGKEGIIHYGYKFRPV